MQVMSILVRSVRVNLASDILRHSSALFCDILLLYSPDSAIFPDMREICGSFFPVRILAEESCEMRESPAECGIGNYGLLMVFLETRENATSLSVNISTTWSLFQKLRLFCTSRGSGGGGGYYHQLSMFQILLSNIYA